MNGTILQRIVVMTFLLAGLTPSLAWGGWIVEWTNTAIKRSGDRLKPEPATMYIDKNRVRVEQPAVTTIIDYDNDRFTVIDPKRMYFWSGKAEDYLTEMARDRAEAVRKRTGKGPVPDYGLPKIDEKSLPAIEIKKTEETSTIAEHPAKKYEVHSNGELFQEIWLAEDIDMTSDLNPKKFLDYQVKMSRGMLGKSSGPFNALYRSNEYSELLKKGFVLDSTVHHASGGFEKKATAIQRADIPAGQFVVPESYRRVRLRDVFPKAEEEGTKK